MLKEFMLKSTLLLVIVMLTGQAVAQQSAIATISEDHMKLMLGDKVLLQNDQDGYMSLKQVKYSPDKDYFVVIGCGYECNDNVGFIFKSDGSGKLKITDRWDFILQDKVEWSADGKRLLYYRINSTGGEPPENSPPEGWVEVDLTTGRKSPAANVTGSYYTSIVKRPHGTVMISGPLINRNSGKVLDIVGRNPKDGATIQQWGYADQPNQNWNVIDLGNNEVAIVSAFSGRALDIQGEIGSDGSKIHQTEWNGGKTQRWRLEKTGNRWHRIVNVGSNKCLDVSNYSKENGADVWQWECHGRSNQQWQVGAQK
jgi:hypothetical protein